MTAQVLEIKDFLKRLRVEGLEEIPFTWLIGAGVSVSSGIPIARDISRRIILFEYIISEEETRPWKSNSNKYINYREDLSPFFDWYDSCEENQESYFLELLDKATQWLKRNKSFIDITPENPECYQRLFQNLLQSTTIHQHFLTTLVTRAKSVNLAHLGLAGLLRDYHEWGHTVFTTNFDDLLLKALLSVNHTARVFGDIQSVDKPSLKPKYPQIVHLHGRHTGYRMLNTQDQISIVDPNFQEGFSKHIADSHLIVLGYSGWDDLVMKTLKRWQEIESLVRGNLYWIPYKSEDRIMPKVRDFLDNCPVNRVKIIVNKNRNLNADSFVLALCDELNSKNGGFEPYRKGIINYAKNQHNFVFKQLEDYPEYDPRRAINIALLAKENCKKGDITEAINQKKFAEKLVKADDLSEELKGKVYFEIGIVEMLLKKTNDAINYLNQALLIWAKLKVNSLDAKLEEAHTYNALGQVYLKIGDVEESKKNFKLALAAYNDVEFFQGIGLINKLLGEIALRESKLNKAGIYLNEAWKNLQQLSSNEVNCVVDQASCLRVLGDYYRLQGYTETSVENYQSAQKLFDSVEDNLGVANTLVGLSKVALINDNFDEASKYLKQAKEIYQNENNLLGVANIENTLGDLNYRRSGYTSTSLKNYLASAEYYRQIDAKHGLANAYADILKCLDELEDHEEVDEQMDLDQDMLIDTLKDITIESQNAYAREILIDSTSIQPDLFSNNF